MIRSEAASGESIPSKTCLISLLEFRSITKKRFILVASPTDFSPAFLLRPFHVLLKRIDVIKLYLALFFINNQAVFDIWINCTTIKVPENGPGCCLWMFEAGIRRCLHHLTFSQNYNFHLRIQTFSLR